MKYVITENQYSRIFEFFNPYEYYKWMKHDAPYEIDFETFRNISKFQKYVDLITKYSLKQSPVDNLIKMAIYDGKSKPWGTNFNRPESKGLRMDWTLYLKPKIQKNTPIEEYEKMKSQYEDFKNIFRETARMMGFTMISAVETEGISEYKIDYEFDEINPQEMVKG